MPYQYHARQNLISPISELATDGEEEEEEVYDYKNSRETFHKSTIFQYVADEVNAFMHELCCENSCLTTFYNPLYLIFFVLFYILTLPGAWIHYLLLDCIPVRKEEHIENNELRSRGIYMALGIAIINLPFAIIGLFLGTDIMVMVNEVALAVNLCVIVTNLIGLKVIAEEKLISVRVYIVGAWIIFLFLIGLIIFDVYSYVTFSWVTIVEFFLRLVEILVYGIISIKCLEFWSLYDAHNYKSDPDIYYAISLGVLFLGIILAFVVLIVFSEENAWRIMYW